MVRSRNQRVACSGRAVFVLIVTPVALNDPGFRNLAARFAGDARDGVNQRVTLGDIMAVSDSERYRERDALRFGDEMVV